MATEAIAAHNPEREAFYEKIAGSNLAPLWERLHGLVTAQPVTPCLPAIWRYRDVRPYLMQAGRLISAEEATRRVLILENPGLKGHTSITHSLFAGIAIDPAGRGGAGASPHPIGIALHHRRKGRLHRGRWRAHDDAARRFRHHARPGPGTITATTPRSRWSGSTGSTSRSCACSMRALPNRARPKCRPVARPEGDNAARFANNLVPVDWQPAVKTSPVFNYPYARSRASLDVLARNEDPDPCHGHKLRYVNPANGDFAMPTIGAFIQLLPKGFATRPYRSTDGTVFVAVEGAGESRVGDQVLRWEPRDVFVVPSWATVSHQAADEAVLFSYSDRPVQRKARPLPRAARQRLRPGGSRARGSDGRDHHRRRDRRADPGPGLAPRRHPLPHL